MGKFDKAAKLLGKIAEEATPKVEEAVTKLKKPHYSELPDVAADMKPRKMHYSELPDDPNAFTYRNAAQEERAFNSELHKVNNRRLAGGNQPLTPEQFRAYKANKTMPNEPVVPRKVQEQGPVTLAETNKLHHPDISGTVDYARQAEEAANPLLKKSNAIAAMSPLAAAQDLYGEAQESPLGQAATYWNKVKSMLADKAAQQMDLTGGKDPEFQKTASGVLSTTLDPVNFIPGAGGLAAGAAEMLAKEPEDENNLKKKKP